MIDIECRAVNISYARQNKMSEQSGDLRAYRLLPPPGAPQTPPTSPQRALTGSPNKRRRLLQLTDDNEGEMSIEAFIYRSDDYRSSTTRVPLPLPLCLEKPRAPISDLLNSDSKLRADIFAQLDLHFVYPHVVEFFLQSKPGYPGKRDLEVLALHIQVDMPDDASRQEWSQAKRAVQSLLEDYGLNDAEVEIWDPTRCYEPVLLHVHPNDPYIALYESVRYQIVLHVNMELGRSWNSMCLYKVRPNKKVASTTYDIVITVDALTHHDWAALRAAVLGILDSVSTTREQPIGVHIIPGITDSAPPSDVSQDREMPGRSFFENPVLEKNPGIGASIGVEGSLGGGTLGGYMTLSIAGETHRGFLTNSHVVAPPEDASAELKKRYDLFGVSLDDDLLDPVRTNIHWMTIKDIDATKDDITRQRESLLDTAKELEATINAYREIGRDHHAQERRLRAVAKRLDAIVTATQVCSTMPRSMGRILFSSGRALSARGYILDTAFVKVPEADPVMWNHCLDRNRLPKSTAAGLFKKLPKDYCCGTDGREDIYLEPSAITGIGPLVKGNWYFKIGRTTDITTGICHGTEAYVNMGGTRSKYDTVGRRGEYEDVGFTTEYVILGSQTKGDEAAHPFSDSGDLGSFIIDHNGQVVAQLFGFMKGHCGPSPTIDYDVKRRGNIGTYYASTTGLVTPMDRIVEDIELITAPKNLTTGQRTGPGAIIDVI